MSDVDCGCTPKVDSSASPALRKALFTVVVLNGIMSVVGLVASIIGRSQAIQADGLDFLGDAVATGISLAVISSAIALRARVAWWQGFALGALGVGVLLGAIYRAIVGGAPEPAVMSVYGVVGLFVNLACALMLLKHRGGNSSVHAAWLYSRNDALGNIAVLGAGLVVAFANSRWPDLAVALVLAALFIHSAIGIMRRANMERSTQ
ncbi:MAG: cation transporter [Deltaproteobacteria bacterium]|nr:cation transporter [Deltaproteobacteria bacterium]